MGHHILIRLIAILIPMTLVACDSTNDRLSILDAAALYENQTDAFVEIVLSYPAPFTEFTRIPARDPSNETAANERFIKRLRKKIPIESIDFFPRSEGGRDEINIVLRRYSTNDYWTIVSVIYISKPLLPPDREENKALFDKCDDRSLEWLERNKATGPVTAICRIKEHWYAVQKIG